jgi:hypothetical protein
MLVTVSIVSSLVALSTAHVVRHAHAHGEAHVEERGLPASAWYHEDPGHPVHLLFKRDAASTDGQTYAAVGSDRESYPLTDISPLSFLSLLICSFTYLLNRMERPVEGNAPLQRPTPQGVVRCPRCRRRCR